MQQQKKAAVNAKKKNISISSFEVLKCAIFYYSSGVKQLIKIKIYVYTNCIKN